MINTRKAPRAVATVGAVSLLLAGCGGDDGGSSGGSSGGGGELDGASLSVGSKEFTESIVLAQITLQALENAGADVEDRTGISGSATVREALEADEIDMYWEYTGTGWVNILGNTTEDVPEELYQAVADADAENGIAWLEPAPFEDTYRIAVPADFAEENDLATMSDAAAFIKDNPDEGAVCAASEFINRDDGLPGLEKAYGFEFSEVVELDLNLIYTQVGDTCSFGEVFSTDGRIVSNDLVILEDDQDFFVEYRGALTLRQETLDEFPAIADVMAPIGEALTDEVVTELNAQVDVEGREPADVAEEWLDGEGLLG
ncbi:MAG: glycine/betaine ABC transporter substrate-binding protein [Actinomycetota bacterium]|nr:glycine/betaine ABC transporter substrate-binding protein [Actinomycetota bacterium]